MFTEAQFALITILGSNTSYKNIMNVLLAGEIKLFLAYVNFAVKNAMLTIKFYFIHPKN